MPFLIALLLFCLAPVLAAAQDRIAPPDITWEITNRFAPFEAQDDPDFLFARWGLRADDGNWQGWHERLWRALGDRFASPYADALKRDRATHWDQARQGHSAQTLDFIQREHAPTTMIRIRLWVEDAAPCTWTIGDEVVRVTHCSERLKRAIPLAGTHVTVRLDSGLGQSRFLKPRHHVAVALGDSYGSGEGNPDLPARWNNRIVVGADKVGWMTSTEHLRGGERGYARWLDDRCDRSFFSHQSLTALGIASRDPHVFVSFLHYACSGAEVFDGVLTPQNQPGGNAGFNNLSQLNAALGELCLDPVTAPAAVAPEALAGQNLRAFARRNGTMLRPNDRLDVNMRPQRTETGQRDFPRSGIVQCASGRLRVPDTVLLSVGGNDIGFAQIVHYFVVPVSHSSHTMTALALPDLCPAPEFRADPVSFPLAAERCAALDRRLGHHVGDLIGSQASAAGIGARYRLLFSILRHSLKVTPEQIVMAQYPDPLRLTEGSDDRCGPVAQPVLVHGSPPGFDPGGPWNGLRTSLPEPATNRWPFNLLEDEARKVLLQFDAFRQQLSLTARAEGIIFACATRDAFLGHGWWQGKHLRLPNAPPNTWAPALWQPYRYEPFGRAVRTGNDSALTQADGAPAISGAVHPNLLGHVLIADGVMQRLEEDR
ncbi:hypothetical protein [Aliiroseovarius subalbicans]|uniref:hypothetical protein n=1 Tax=Aliiroseovarius subalbicans TaxID=2925840 RepID=UPI001F576138|nr:hypothetical protein [Aliiroseovarius subalbicans]MCI2398617.1 hypothetical protein [Aliiroseovarius subalbicans]